MIKKIHYISTCLIIIFAGCKKTPPSMYQTKKIVSQETAVLEKKFIVPPLPYAYDALEPYLDTKTMKIHYLKHHQGYADKLNQTLKSHPEFFDQLS